MKKYIEPKNRCVEIELESLVAYSPQGMQSGAALQNLYDEENVSEQLVKEQNNFGGSSPWDNEW